MTTRTQQANTTNGEKIMNTTEKYKDSGGKACSLYQMVRREPDWAASRIRVGEKALDALEKIKEWDDGQYGLPYRLRELIVVALAHQ